MIDIKVAKVSKKDPQHRSHLLTASGRFKHPWRHYKKILILKLFKKLDGLLKHWLLRVVLYAVSSIVEIGEIMCLNLTPKQK